MLSAITTSGVVLSTPRQAADFEFSPTLMSDGRSNGKAEACVYLVALLLCAATDSRAAWSTRHHADEPALRVRYLVAG